MLDHILLIFGPKLALYIYIGNTVPGNNPAARFSLPFHEYAELEAPGPLIGKILSIGIKIKTKLKTTKIDLLMGGTSLIQNNRPKMTEKR